LSLSDIIIRTCGPSGSLFPDWVCQLKFKHSSLMTSSSNSDLRYPQLVAFDLEWVSIPFTINSLIKDSVIHYGIYGSILTSAVGSTSSTTLANIKSFSGPLHRDGNQINEVLDWWASQIGSPTSVFKSFEWDVGMVIPYHFTKTCPLSFIDSNHWMYV